MCRTGTVRNSSLSSSVLQMDVSIMKVEVVKKHRGDAKVVKVKYENKPRFVASLVLRWPVPEA
jgi:hypothetical protein